MRGVPTKDAHMDKLINFLIVVAAVVVAEKIVSPRIPAL